MKIAILGWGSLIWEPQELKHAKYWRSDGPKLPIEFARISNDCRPTLVLHPGVNLVTTCWTLSTCLNLHQAIENLEQRECVTNPKRIGFLSLKDDEYRCCVVPDSLDSIRTWAKYKNFHAVVWTDLPSKFRYKQASVFFGSGCLTVFEKT